MCGSMKSWLQINKKLSSTTILLVEIDCLSIVTKHLSIGKWCSFFFTKELDLTYGLQNLHMDDNKYFLEVTTLGECNNLLALLLKSNFVGCWWFIIVILIWVIFGRIKKAMLIKWAPLSHDQSWKSICTSIKMYVW